MTAPAAISPGQLLRLAFQPNAVFAELHSVAQGRNGVMPAFGPRLDDAQVRMLVAWLTRRERDSPDSNPEPVRSKAGPR